MVTIKAYDDNVLVGTATMTLDQSQHFVALATYSNANNRFTSIDRVEVDGSNSQVAMDDLLLNTYAGGERDVIDLPTGYDVAKLVASAKSDGHGGTVLTHSEGTVTLVGVDPAMVNEAWFV